MRAAGIVPYLMCTALKEIVLRKRSFAMAAVSCHATVTLTLTNCTAFIFAFDTYGCGLAYPSL